MCQQPVERCQQEPNTDEGRSIRERRPFSLSLLSALQCFENNPFDF